ELLAAIGLILPAVTDTAPVMVPVTAACWVLLMIGATAVHYRLGQPRLAMLTSAYLAVAAFVALGRFRPESFTGLRRRLATSARSPSRDDVAALRLRPGVSRRATPARLLCRDSSLPHGAHHERLCRRSNGSHRAAAGAAAGRRRPRRPRNDAKRVQRGHAPRDGRKTRHCRRPERPSGHGRRDESETGRHRPSAHV